MATEEADGIIGKCFSASEDGLQVMRSAAIEMFGQDSQFIIGANGSYARREVTSGSDVDLFFLAVQGDPKKITGKQIEFREYLKSTGFKLPADDGVFKNPLSVSKTRDTIGGMEDKNESITRRMLLLLEGEWLFNEKEFEVARKLLLDRYLDDVRRDDQICLFLLNDIIRYWRTICVDFEYKIRDGDKARAIRLVKLRFSRLMLYLAGILAVGETHNIQCKDKSTFLMELLSMPTLKRFSHIVGEKGDGMLNLYADFLSTLDDEKLRGDLNQLGPKGEETEVFGIMRKKARMFHDLADEVLKTHFSDSNPTLSALIL